MFESAIYAACNEGYNRAAAIHNDVVHAGVSMVNVWSVLEDS